MNNLFAIEHIPSGKLLPLPPELSHGFSRVEPGDAGPPRLFLDEVSAVRALAQWLRGSVTLNLWGFGEDYETEFKLESKPHRKRDEMRVVPVEIKKRRIRQHLIRKERA